MVKKKSRKLKWNCKKYSKISKEDREGKSERKFCGQILKMSPKILAHRSFSQTPIQVLL